MIFQHTYKEPGMWRGWFKNGQSLELSWKSKQWNYGAGVHIHSNDADRGDRMLFLQFWRLTAVIPLGVIDHPWEAMEAPQWSLYASQEFGLTVHWGHRRRSFDWPWSLHSLAYEQMLPDGSWIDVFKRDMEPYTEVHSYTYMLKSGKVQNRIATLSKRRHVLCRRAFRFFKWPKWTRESINVNFSDEIGERTGSWKGGCIGCSHDMLPGESMEDSLRRMEKERKF